MLIGMISLASSYYAGDSDIFNNTLGDNLVWTIVDNSSVLSVLPVIEINSTHIKIFFPYNMPPDNFTIVFLEESTNTVVKKVNVGGGGGGGGSRTKYITNTEYKEVPNYITEYVNNTIENNPKSEVIEVEKKNPINIFNIVLTGILILVLVILFKFYLKKINIIDDLKKLPKVPSVE